MHYKRGTPAERLWPRIEKQDDGCWIWAGGVTTDGYGNIGHPRGIDLPRSTHRLAWTLTYGPIPEGAQVLHRCDVRRCINPEHLFLGDHRTNMSDMAAKGRGVSGNGLKTHCKRGHEFTPENTRIVYRPHRSRACKACHRLLQRQYWTHTTN